MKSYRTAAIAALALAGAGMSAEANAASIVLNGVDSIQSAGARVGYKVAAKYWEKMLTNDVTIVFDVGFDSLDPGVLGSTGSTGGNLRVSTAYQGLVNTAKSSIDAQAIASLATQLTAGGGNSVNALATSVTDGTTYLDNDGSFNNQVLYVNTAVMKAIGVTGYTGTDANITFSSDFAFDFDPTDGIDAGTSDFVGVAIHEMGHGLGFVSGVDYYDLIQCPNGPFCGYFEANFGVDGDEVMNGDSWLAMLDLFRYSSAGQLDWTTGTPSYFSFDDGLTQFNGNSKFSSGAFNGDGWQASHWQAPLNEEGTDFSCTRAGRIGIMNPYFCGGDGGDVTASDLAAFDAIGWNTRVDALSNPGYRQSTGDIYSELIGQVPEPSTWAMLILGFGLTGAAMRRKGKVRTAFAF